MKTIRHIDKDWWNYYFWRIKGYDRKAERLRTWTQLEFMREDHKGQTRRCSKTPETFAEVYEISLVPRQHGLPLVTTSIPKGGRAVYFRRVTAKDGVIGELLFVIGWELNGLQVLMAVDSQTGTVRGLLE